MRILDSLDSASGPTAIALGNFDGIHLGHQQVIAPVQAVRHPHPDWTPSVVTFNPHPQAFFSGNYLPSLTPTAEKAELLAGLGIEQLILLPFTRELANLTPEQFVADVLVEQLQARQISVGQDFRFGRGRSGSAQDLQAIAQRQGIPTTIVPLLKHRDLRISSSAIRKALDQGQPDLAAAWLGRPYRLAGCVVPGQQLGRQLGTPTANLQIPADKLLPRWGVYAGRAHLPEQGFRDLPAVLNIGQRPTLNGDRTISVEVHLLDWQGDCYGQLLQIDLQSFLRPEQKFDTLTALTQQIQQDCRTARSQLTAQPSSFA
ncbi:bifunctional riboflavin kinase/FAD synthetase [Synechococcus elongatus]|uniref:bifunctional riboflavin kinase/FAD synthetase n=1 Tax=Synechococcus elongatus TaxID=32046 RepID=UPI0030CC4473